MSGKACSLCNAPMVSLAAKTPGGTAMYVSYCRICDRRRCAECGHNEQNVFAKKCTNCGGRY